MRKIAIVIASVLGIAGALIAALGMSWIIDVAPLLMFVGVGVVYGVLSANRSVSHRRATARGPAWSPTANNGRREISHD